MNTLYRWTLKKEQNVLQDFSYLQVFHNIDQLSAVGQREAAALVEDDLQLITGQLIKM